MDEDRKVLPQAAAVAPVIEVELAQEGTRTCTTVAFVNDEGKPESYTYASTTFKESTQAHRVAHALRDLAFYIDLHNRE